MTPTDPDPRIIIWLVASLGCVLGLVISAALGIAVELRSPEPDVFDRAIEMEQR